MLGMKKGNVRIKSVSMLKIEIHNSWVIIIWVICHWIRLWNENHSLLCIRRELDWRKICFGSNYLFQCRPYAFLTCQYCAIVISIVLFDWEWKCAIFVVCFRLCFQYTLKYQYSIPSIDLITSNSFIVFNYYLRFSSLLPFLLSIE